MLAYLYGVVAAGAVNQKLAVDVYGECTVNALKIDIVSFTALFLQVKCTAIMPARVLIRKMRKHYRERVSCVQILNLVKSMHLNT